MPNPKNSKTILIVDDEEVLRHAVSYCLKQELYHVIEAGTPEEMFHILETSEVNVLLLDLYLDDSDSLRHLSRLRSKHPQLQIIMVTGSGTIDMAVEAIRQGCYDFITKPVDTKRLTQSVYGALKLTRLATEKKRNHPSTLANTEYQEIIGESPAIQHLRKQIQKVAVSNCAVLVIGETGTGKELVAQSIQDLSARTQQPMAIVNCAALPGDLVESELFGHEKGAFTGAVQRKIGFAERANKGTLFLDEIGEMPIDLQAKLLRFLQEKTFHRVGGSEPIRVDVRMICATNRDPQHIINDKQMREDLYYRVSEVTLRVPALRERKEDIPLLAKAFLERTARREKKRFKTFDSNALRILTQYHWPGNIRHLLNVITETVVLNEGECITVDMLPFDLVQSVNDQRSQLHPSGDSLLAPPSAVIPLWQEEKRAIQQALITAEGNVTQAAHMLEVSKATLYRKIKEYNLPPR